MKAFSDRVALASSGRRGEHKGQESVDEKDCVPGTGFSPESDGDEFRADPGQSAGGSAPLLLTGGAGLRPAPHPVPALPGVFRTNPLGGDSGGGKKQTRFAHRTPPGFDRIVSGISRERRIPTPGRCRRRVRGSKFHPRAGFLRTPQAGGGHPETDSGGTPCPDRGDHIHPGTTLAPGGIIPTGG